MTERDAFKQEIAALLANYHEEVLNQRYARLILNLAHSLQIINVDKEIEPNFFQIVILKSGRVVSIVKDDRFYYLIRNSEKDLRLFCPRRTLSEIELEFDEIENELLE